jgi:hypothetical protein
LGKEPKYQVEHTFVNLRPYLLAEKLDVYTRLKDDFKANGQKRTEKIVSGLV